jgi:hypothetical protein
MPVSSWASDMELTGQPAELPRVQVIREQILWSEADFPSQAETLLRSQ